MRVFQEFVEILADVVLQKDASEAVVVLHVLLFSWPSFTQGTSEQEEMHRSESVTLSVDTVFGCIAKVCAFCPKLDKVAQFCSAKIASHGIPQKYCTDIPPSDQEASSKLTSGLNLNPHIPLNCHISK